MCEWARFGATSRNRFFYWSLLCLFVIPVCRSVLINRTIDSNFGDPVTGFKPGYQPQGPWADQTCSGCYIQPDTTKAFNGTWEAATYHPTLQNVNITLNFTGVAVWVFFILPNANDHGSGTTTNTQVNITLDGQYAGNFSHDPDMTTHDLLYNQTIFSTTGLANTSHVLVIATNDYPISTFLAFDWAMYTVDIPAPQDTSSSSTTAFTSTTSPFSTDNTSSSSPSPTPQSTSSNIGVIVGPTIGGLVALIALLLFFLVRRRRRVPLLQTKKTEGILDIDVAPRQPPNNYPKTLQRDPLGATDSETTSFPASSSVTQSPVADSAQYTARLREARQMESDERMQHAMEELKSARYPWAAGEVGGPPTAVPPGEIALLRTELQQLRDQVGNLQAQRGPEGLSDEPLPPAYTRQ